MRCPSDRRHRSVCCGFECTYVSSSNAKSIVWVLTIYTRNPTSEQLSDARSYWYRRTVVTVNQWPDDENERHATYTLNTLKQKQCPCLSLYNSVRFPGTEALLSEGPQASVVLLVRSAYGRSGFCRTGRMIQKGDNRISWRTRPCATLPTGKLIWIGLGMNPGFCGESPRLAIWVTEWLTTRISWIDTFWISVPTSQRTQPVSTMNTNQLMLNSRPIWISYGSSMKNIENTSWELFWENVSFQET